MSDNHRTPQPPEADEPDPAVADRLRRTLHAVAAATPVLDRRAALVADLDTLRIAGPDVPADRPEEDDAMRLDARTPAPTPIWRRPIVLAAAAAILVAVAVGVLVGRGPDEPLELDPAQPDAAPITGWFVPPEGWEITAVRTDFLDVGESGACPCRVLTAAAEGEAPAGIVVYETVGDPGESFDSGIGTQVDVGGRPGEIIDDSAPVLSVGTEGRHLLVVGWQVEEAAMVEVADAWLDRVEAGEPVDGPSLPFPDGMIGGEVRETPGVRNVSAVDVTAVELSTGRTTYYQLVPAGAFYSFVVIQAEAVTLRDGLLEVESSAGVTPMLTFVGGQVDVVVGPSFFADEGDLRTVEELRAFASGLRQVSVAEWRAALADADVEAPVLEAETLLGPPLVDTGPED